MGLLQSLNHLVPREMTLAWSAPSNIAFVKYWGKKGHQLPANPSLSMTLKYCVSKSSVRFSPADELRVSLTLGTKDEPRFAEKIKKYLLSLESELPWISKLHVDVKTENTFPHGAGIASSASGLSAFALCLTDYIHQLSNLPREELFFKRASYLSRLASGSACRSLYGGFTTWGKSELESSTDEYASVFEVHPELKHLKDTVMVVSGKEKNVSSRAGHDRMKEHPFAEARFVQAKNHFTGMVAALQSGDVERMGRILESEALSLHAMMLTAPDSFTLLQPNTLRAIEIVRAFRAESKIPLFFTLDAGPNLHLIYPEAFEGKVRTFIEHELTSLAEHFILDEIGEGPVKL